MLPTLSQVMTIGCGCYSDLNIEAYQTDMAMMGKIRSSGRITLQFLSCWGKDIGDLTPELLIHHLPFYPNQWKPGSYIAAFSFSTR